MSQNSTYSYLFAVFAMLMVVLVAYALAGPQIDTALKSLQPFLATLGV